MKRARISIALALFASCSLVALGCEGVFGVDFDGLSLASADAAPESSEQSGIDGDVDAALACPSGDKPCGDRCVATDDVTTGCGGASCGACPGAEHGTSRCDDLGCAIECDSGYRRCQSGCCVSDGSPVTAGVTHSCATASSGAVYCWGNNDKGQLGDRSTTSHSTPVLAYGLEGGGRALAVGIDFSLEATASGSVFAWGGNEFGQLGDGSNNPRDTPFPIASISGAAYVTASGWRGCSVSHSGRAQCWGYNVSGAVGGGDAAPQIMVPVAVEQAEAFSVLASGSAHACAVGVSGALYCWGANSYGQLGLSSAAPNVLVPTRVPDAVATANVVAVAAGTQHTCAIVSTGEVRCWGDNSQGQLGVGDTDPRELSVFTLQASEGATRIAAGDQYTCVVLASGSVKCWGLFNGFAGSIGVSPQRTLRPTLFDVGGPVAYVAAGSNHACARMLDGRVRCWGANGAGQLGDGTNVDRSAPVDVALPN